MPATDMCIGPTHWGTHGPLTDENAHSDCSEEFAVVHDGIIENQDTLPEQLSERGHTRHHPSAVAD